MEFSVRTRQANLQRMEAGPLDLLVIGGGITGAGIAWDATLRGLRVGLVEMQDFGAGTSSRSTKLIHGGLRYLAQREFALVREVGRERALLHRLAGHVVHPMHLLLPIYKGGQYGRFGTSIGLWMYDRLAEVDRAERRTMLSRAETLAREPGLQTAGLQGGGLYVEYRTDDARLTMEVMKTAHEHGALVAHYAKAQELLYGEDGRVCGAQVIDLLSGHVFAIKAQAVINAAGPWVDDVRRLEGELDGKRLHLTKGVHLVVNHADLPIRNALYIGTNDGRMVFLIPRDGTTYIGTTDTTYHDDTAAPVCTEEDCDYLLATVNQHFPERTLTRAHVQSSWAGLRPLIHEEGKGPSELSRKEEIFVSRSGLYSMAGGKLTGFRKMAEKIVDRVVQDLALTAGPNRTGETMLSGGELGSGGLDGFRDAMRREGQARYGLDTAVVDALVGRYGANVRAVFALIDGDHTLKERVGGPLPIIRADVRYAVQQEMTVSLTDYLLRRTGDLLFDATEALESAPHVLDALAEDLHWNATERELQETCWHRAVAEARGFLSSR